MRQAKSGFTLIEMLVVIGIISILMGALFYGFGGATKSAQRQKITEVVQNAHTALEQLLFHKQRWPTDLDNTLVKHGGKDGSGFGMVEDVAKVLAKYGVLNVAYKGDKNKISSIQLIGQDRCGIVDPLAAGVLKRKAGAEGAGKNLPVSSGGTVQDHIIYYALDDDHDGIVQATVCGENIRVRAKAITWAAGPDGKLGSGYKKKNKDNADNVYSWARGQEVK